MNYYQNILVKVHNSLCKQCGSLKIKREDWYGIWFYYCDNCKSTNPYGDVGDKFKDCKPFDINNH